MIERDLDIAWLAGIVDGEGCLSYTRSWTAGRKNPGFSALLAISMYSQETLERVGRITGSNVRSHPNYDNTVWEVGVQGEKLAELLCELLPHMTTKRREALLLMEAIAQCPSLKSVRGTQGHRSLTAEELAMREGFHTVLQTAKSS